ncbi:hypothetical protein OGR47_21090 (plasmid) [Methylocystis sp. MJC1]|uniref:HEAT repeat domain-containing protein n=1 Tax=Methylocystis sp. MJC1 TaxID=2654282 RepID=UPI0013EB4025|nr:hypothetical protein [Methylocystis sp. MJC1]KAF2988836.1 hypothetical protein MJC1_04080 [Methylocystis sp. MJC1]MBU6529391.1 hypothetical protein [Methylocystis sp. MJC1]UZX14127.1 hypothetical protein OGR47_21090 [Methylocystis sp. MJC1]
MYFFKEIDGSLQRASTPDDVRLAVNRLKSLHDGESAIIDVVSFGKQAIPALRRLLFTREPTGMYHPRCLAVRALAALQDCDGLIDFLKTPTKRSDALEAIGDEAVINAAARALAKFPEERVFEFLLSVAEREYLPGVIDALGSFEKVETIPFLVAALSDDDCRRYAEGALLKLGSSARQSLITTIVESPSDEGGIALRKRVSALRLLIEIGLEAQSWPILRHLMWDRNPKLAALVCGIALEIAPPREKKEAVSRLNALLGDIGWTLAREIERQILAHFQISRVARLLSHEEEKSFSEFTGMQVWLPHALRRLAALIDWRGH